MYLYVEDCEKTFMGGRVGDVKECKEFWKVERYFAYLYYYYYYYYYLHVGNRKGKSWDEFGSCGD